MLHAAVHGYECVVDKAGGAGRVTAYERPKMKRLVAEAKQVQCGSKPAAGLRKKYPCAHRVVLEVGTEGVSDLVLGALLALPPAERCLSARLGR